MKLLVTAIAILVSASLHAETIWVTKYALIRGVQKFESAQLFADGNVAVVGDTYFRKGEYYLSEQDAKERAETLRKARIAALLRELERLQAIK